MSRGKRYETEGKLNYQKVFAVIIAIAVLIMFIFIVKNVLKERENVTTNPSKEYTATGKYCGFIDSTSVEVELSDGSYCSFFVFDEEVRSTLSALNEEDMPEISFTYKAKEGQVNPEMTSVIGG